MDSNKTLKLLDLEKRTGYEITQTNGQRKYGPPPNWAGPPPPKGSEIFIGKIPRFVYEDELVPVFEKVGIIYEMRLMMDFSGTNRGYGFVRYSCPQEAENAVKELDNYEIRPGLFIGVIKSVDNCRLFIGGLPKDKTKEDIFYELTKQVDDVKEVILYKSIVDKSKSRGFAFVEFENHKAAAMARRKLIPNRLVLWGQILQVDWALPEPEIDEETMSKVTVLFIRNLSLSTSEGTIVEAMQTVVDPNVIERIKKLKDFAFVHFKDRENAKKCLDYWDGKMLESSVIEVKWAKPSPKQYIQDVRTFRKRFLPSHFHSNWRNGSPYIAMPGQGIVSQVSEVKIPQFPGNQTQFQSHKLSFPTQDAKTPAADSPLYHLNHSQPIIYTDGYEHGRMMQFAASGYTSMPPQREVAIAYTLQPNQTPGYVPVVHDKIQGLYQLPV